MTDDDEMPSPRVRHEPVLTTTCGHCNNPFWFKKSMGYRTHNGHYASWRVTCGWCSRPQYLPVDENDRIVDDPIPSRPTSKDLEL